MQTVHSIKPRWLKSLFTLFAANYKNLWTDSFAEHSMEEANNFLWMTTLKGYDEQIILDAAVHAIKNYHFPPSIQQFVEIVNGLAKHKNLEKSTKNVLDYKHSHKAPPSPLLAEYMLKNPPKANDPFKKIFEESHGNERGKRVMAEIKRQLGAKLVSPK